jgi:hypothetical protein
VGELPASRMKCHAGVLTPSNQTRNRPHSSPLTPVKMGRRSLARLAGAALRGALGAGEKTVAGKASSAAEALASRRLFSTSALRAPTSLGGAWCSPPMRHGSSRPAASVHMRPAARAAPHRARGPAIVVDPEPRTLAPPLPARIARLAPPLTRGSVARPPRCRLAPRRRRLRPALPPRRRPLHRGRGPAPVGPVRRARCRPSPAAAAAAPAAAQLRAPLSHPPPVPLPPAHPAASSRATTRSRPPRSKRWPSSAASPRSTR